MCFFEKDVKNMQKIMMCSKRVLVGDSVGNSNRAYSSIICWGTQLIRSRFILQANFRLEFQEVIRFLFCFKFLTFFTTI